jgi:hypothetical protein
MLNHWGKPLKTLAGILVNILLFSGRISKVKVFVQYWYRFLQTDKNSKMEIIIVSEKTVKAKMTVYGETNIKALSDLGVTLEEYANFYGKYSGTLADHLGLKYEQKFEDG